MHHWIIDPEAAEVVRKVYAMALEGKGNETIARLLQEQKILTPQSYWQSKGVGRSGSKTQINPCKWCKSTVAKMLAQQEYCGDIINFKTYSKSFKYRKRFENPEKNQVVFRNIHEAIIDRDTWENVQRLIQETKRRPCTSSENYKSMFSGLLFCGDCGSSMRNHFNRRNHSIRFFDCGNYNANRGTCDDTHYIREDALYQVVLAELRRFASWLEYDENALAEALETKVNKDILAKRKNAEKSLQAAVVRMEEVNNAYGQLYEKNINGMISDEWFMQLSAKYTAEKDDLKVKIEELRSAVMDEEKASISKDQFLKAIHKFLQMDELDAALLKELVEKIEVFPAQGKGKDKTQRVIIHYRFVGAVTLPAELPGKIKKQDTRLNTRQGIEISYFANI